MKIKNLAVKRMSMWTILSIVSFCIASCAMPGLIWTETPYQGPLIAGNKYAPVMERCERKGVGAKLLTF